MANVIETDVAVVGGGLAGLFVAIGAAEQGARVVVMEKARIERSGAIGGGVDHCLAYLNEGEPWDTRDGYLAFVKKAAAGAVDIAVHEKIYCDELTAAIKRMEKIGCPMHDPATGSYYRTRSFGAPGAYWINFDGKNLKPLEAREVRRLGCEVLDHVSATKLFIQNERIAGVSGYNIRTGEFAAIRCPAVVVATGATNRLYETPTGMPFNTWLCPYDTGAAQALAFDAGAELANMEYVRMTIVPKGFSAPGLNAFTGEGARFINALGEPFMTKYHKLGDRAPRNVLVHACLTEGKEGRGPLFLDCTKLPADNLQQLKATIGTDKDTLPDYFEQKGIDIAEEPFEVEVSEGMQTGPLEVVGSGVKINSQCMSTVEGLFAAGDCADQMKIVHLALTGGYAAGRAAAQYAKRSPGDGLAAADVAAERSRVLAPLDRRSGAHYRDIEDVLRRIMKQYVGPMRTEIGLKTAARKIEQLKGELSNLKAANPHEVIRGLETENLVTVGEIMAKAAQVRRESRFIPYHYRLDYPESNDAEWNGQIVVQKSNESISTEFRPFS
jgi:adenylylsulfate reductase subunit A